jgi:protocatechuate 3,4-dioxygenase beta subunit
VQFDHTPDPRYDETRRLIVHALLVLPAAALIGCGTQALGATASPASPTLPATPACGDDDDVPTPAQTEGPYFKPSSPLRASLVQPGMAGTRLTLSGQVFSTSCQAISGALLDFWQADDSGAYDNAGFRLRGHQFTDASGRFALETIVPGLYPGRTRHLHVKVQRSGGQILTTQLYFPGEPRNGSDGIFSSALLMTVSDAGSAKQATFDFVLR